MITNYEVTLTSDLLDGPLVADVNASNPHAAATRIRMYAFHAFKCPDMLTADCAVKVNESGELFQVIA